MQLLRPVAINSQRNWFLVWHLNGLNAKHDRRQKQKQADVYRVWINCKLKCNVDDDVAHDTRTHTRHTNVWMKRQRACAVAFRHKQLAPMHSAHVTLSRGLLLYAEALKRAPNKWLRWSAALIVLSKCM